MTSRVSAPVAVLAAVVAAVAILVVASSGGGTYEVTAVFDQVNGLVKGADVEVAGTKVGKVEQIRLGEDGLPHVRMKIDGDYRLRRGATANLRSLSVAGEVNRFVSLRAGTGPELSDGAVLPRARTDEPVEVEQVLSTLDPATRREVRGLLAGLDASTQGRGDDIARTLAHSAAALGNTAGLLREVTADGHALKTFVHQGSTVVQTLAHDPAALGATATTLAGLLRTTARRQADLARTADLMAPGLDRPRAALTRLDASLGTLDALVRDARPGVRALVPFSRDLAPTLRAAVPGLRQLDGLVTRSPADAASLRRLLARATPTLDALKPALASGNPILDQLRARLPDFFSFFANWADFTANYDANGHAARVGIVVAPAPNNTVGPDDARAGHLRAPFLRTPGVLEGQPWTNYEKSFIGGGSQP